MIHSVFFTTHTLPILLHTVQKVDIKGNYSVGYGMTNCKKPA